MKIASTTTKMGFVQSRSRLLQDFPPFTTKQIYYTYDFSLEYAKQFNWNMLNNSIMYVSSSETMIPFHKYCYE